VAASVLEFVPDAAATLAEARRVLRPGGRFVGVVPRELPWADALFGRVVGRRPEDDFGGRRAQVRAALDAAGARGGARPRWLPRFLAPYRLAVVATH
jgi:SAM-dependent methyltransferase